MPCGCQSACGCNIVGDGVTAQVARVGDTFTVSAIQAIMGIADTDCIDLSIDAFKILRAVPILAVAADEDASVQLRCTATGLAGDVVIDPASSAIVTTTPDGLRVDVPPAVGGGFGQPGDLVLHFGVGPRANAIDADGSEVLRSGYPALWDALSLYATAATRATGIFQITNIPSTRFIAPGMVVEATSFPLGTTVVTVDSSTAITLSDPATTSGGDTELRVYPHGAGNGTTTFNVPDGNAVYPLGFDYVGGTNVLGDVGGSDTYVLGLANLPQHNHPAVVTGGVQSAGTGITVATTSTDSGHNHGGSTTGGAAAIHNHEPGTARDSEFVTVDDPLTAPDFFSVASLAGTAATDSVSIPTFGGAGNYQQGNRSFTSNDGAHEHTIPSGNAVIGSVSVVTDGGHTHPDDIAVSVGNTGSVTPTAVAIDPPHNVVRWMVHT